MRIASCGFSRSSEMISFPPRPSVNPSSFLHRIRVFPSSSSSSYSSFRHSPPCERWRRRCGGLGEPTGGNIFPALSLSLLLSSTEWKRERSHHFFGPSIAGSTKTSKKASSPFLLLLICLHSWKERALFPGLLTPSWSRRDVPPHRSIFQSYIFMHLQDILDQVSLSLSLVCMNFPSYISLRGRFFDSTVIKEASLVKFLPPLFFLFQIFLCPTSSRDPLLSFLLSPLS